MVGGSSLLVLFCMNRHLWLAHRHMWKDQRDSPFKYNKEPTRVELTTKSSILQSWTLCYHFCANINIIIQYYNKILEFKAILMPYFNIIGMFTLRFLSLDSAGPFRSLSKKVLRSIFWTVFEGHFVRISIEKLSVHPRISQMVALSQF